MAYSFFSQGKKIVRFKRLPNKHIAGYMIYGIFKDNNYESGKRQESLLKDSDGNDVMYINPRYPVKNPEQNFKEIELEYNKNVTWTLPDDAFYGRDYKFQIFINGALLPTLFYDYNKLTRVFTINTTLKEIDPNDTITLKYWRDYIVLEFDINEECDILVKPVFRPGYDYGYHNIII